MSPRRLTLSSFRYVDAGTPGAGLKVPAKDYGA